MSFNNIDKFFGRSAFAVARDLIGSIIEVASNDGIMTAMIVEVELYAGEDDKASHAFANKLTNKTAPMFKRGGALYVYPIYGVHHCLNIVTGEEGVPEAVLIRAVEPIGAMELMSKNREQKDFDLMSLASGPGKVCQSLGINKDNSNSERIEDTNISIRSYRRFEDSQVCVTPRINIDYAQESKLLPYRFFLKDSEFISEKNKYPKPMTFDTLMNIHSQSSVKK